MFGYIWETIKYHARYPFSVWFVRRSYFNDVVKSYDGLFDRLGERDDLIDFLINRMYEVGGKAAFDNMPIQAITDLANHFGVDTFDIAEEIRDPYHEDLATGNQLYYDDAALSSWEGEGGSYVQSP